MAWTNKKIIGALVKTALATRTPAELESLLQRVDPTGQLFSESRTPSPMRGAFMGAGAALASAKKGLGGFGQFLSRPGGFGRPLGGRSIGSDGGFEYEDKPFSDTPLSIAPPSLEVPGAVQNALMSILLPGSRLERH